MKLSKKIIPLFIVFAILLSCVAVPAHAEDYVNTSVSWWDSRLHLAANGSFLGVPGNSIIGMFTGKVCQLSQDGFHHSDSLAGCSTGSDSHGDYAIATCKYCNKQFPVYGSDLSAAYDSYVSELPVNGIDSSGGFLWYPTYLDLSAKSTVRCDLVGKISPDGTLEGYATSVSSDGRSVVLNYSGSGDYDSNYGCGFYGQFICPVAGLYKRVNTVQISYAVNSNGTVYRGSFNYDSESSGTGKDKGAVLSVNDLKYLSYDGHYLAVNATVYFPVYRVIPSDTLSVDTYSVDYRPVSVSAPVTYTDNSGHTQTTETNIVNETNKTVYNPVTGDTTTYDTWDYDYSTRTYTFSGGDKTTTTVTYGDEYMTVKEGDTTYIYNYYVAPSSDTPDNPETPSGSHTHNYTSAVTREATCTTAGIETFTCSECGNSYTKSIAALGHDWTIKEQIPTAYDDNGEIVTQGYTVYKCSRCGEEYKSTDGKPPESGGNSGSSLWDKIGQLLGTVGGGLLGLIGQFFAAIFDALISLAEMVNEKLSTILEMVLGWFEQFPALFSGFMAFLTVIFGFLPEEMLLLLEFGLAAVLFIGILKAIRRR